MPPNGKHQSPQTTYLRLLSGMMSPSPSFMWPMSKKSWFFTHNIISIFIIVTINKFILSELQHSQNNSSVTSAPPKPREEHIPMKHKFRWTPPLLFFLSAMLWITLVEWENEGQEISGRGLPNDLTTWIGHHVGKVLLVSCHSPFVRPSYADLGRGRYLGKCQHVSSLLAETGHSREKKLNSSPSDTFGSHASSGLIRFV